MEERSGQEDKHEHAEERLGVRRHGQFVVGSQRGPKPWPDGKEIRSPGQIQHAAKPPGNMRGDFGILKKVDDNSKQTENASGGNQSAGIKGAGAGLSFVFFLLGGSFDE